MKKAIVWILVSAVVFAAGVYLGKVKFSASGPAAPPPTFFEGGDGALSVDLAGKTIIEVKDGQSIQEAVGKANPGDLIRVYPGTYRETVYIDKDNISLQGVIQKGKWPTLDGSVDGKASLNDAILYSGSNILIENFKIVLYKGNAIMGQAGNNFLIRNNWIVDAGIYGIFPEFGKNGLIEHNVLSGISDAAIYVGMCDNIDVRHNEVFESVAGIEIENSRHCLVESNYTHDNTGGILAFITPGLPIKTCFDVIIRDNFVVNNNHPNFGKPGAIISMLPPGTGIIVMAADDVIIENNIITGNDNTGIVITDLSFGSQLSKDPESEPNPDRVVVLDNVMFNNGNNPVADVKTAMATQMDNKGPDILAYGGGVGSCIRNRDMYRTFGLENYASCELESTDNVKSYLLSTPVAPRVIEKDEKGKMAYYGVCSGCHAYDVRMIGPPTQVIQALYKDNPQGIADYIANPVHKRDDYPEMPPQNYLSEETRLAVAEFMLTLKN
ncbi:MAG: right-handed parallel beta-helix repeat-containing protein [Flavobacteriales bacterium]|nr:right-handed parallel beta-helix repeat-containing protein [Flavobacteriales bacterium]